MVEIRAPLARPVSPGDLQFFISPFPPNVENTVNAEEQHVRFSHKAEKHRQNVFQSGRELMSKHLQLPRDKPYSSACVSLNTSFTGKKLLCRHFPFCLLSVHPST